MGHCKKNNSEESTKRWERRKARVEAANKFEAVQSLQSFSQTDGAEHVDQEEEETGVATQTELSCASIEKIDNELVRNKQIILDLRKELSEHKVPFSEEYFVNDDIVKFYSGLPNMKALLVKKCVIVHERSKLTRFQEFMATIAK